MTDPLGPISERAVAAAGGSKFTLVAAIVQRSHQLNLGWAPLVTGVEIDKPATTALREIAAGVVEVHPRRRRVRREEAA